MDLALDTELARRFLLAILLGGLVGIEREKRREQEGESPVVGGLRTFTLVGLAGATSAWLGRIIGMDLLFVLAGAAIALVFVLAPRAVGGEQEATPGLTTKTAAILVFMLGGATMYGQAETAVALAVTISGILALKEPLHGMVRRVGTVDLVAALKLLFATFIVLPMLPDTALDPWGVLVPSRLWMLVVLISALSLAGYVAVRVLGERRGSVVTGFFGGLVSSTAVTLAFARSSRLPSAVPFALAAGVLLAWTVMFIRVLVEVAVVHAPLLPRLILPMGVMAALSVMAAAFCYYKIRSAPDAPPGEVSLQNPFSLTAAVKFAAFFAAILLAVELVREHAPGSGVYALAALAGTTDVDAITLSMAGTVRDGGDPTQAALAIGVAALTNTLVKATMALTLGSSGFRKVIGVAAGLVTLAGIGALVVTGLGG